MPGAEEGSHESAAFNFQLLGGNHVSPTQSESAALIRRGDNREDCGARRLTSYTSPFPLGSKHSDKLLSDPKLARYIVPFTLESDTNADTASDVGQATLDIFKELQSCPLVGTDVGF